MTSPPPLSPPAQQQPGAPTNLLSTTSYSTTPPLATQVPIAQMHQLAVPVSTYPMLSSTAARMALGVEQNERPEPRPSTTTTTTTNSQSDPGRLRAMLPAGHLVAISSPAEIAEMQRRLSAATGPPPRWNTVSLARLPGFNGRATHTSSGPITRIPLGGTSSIRGTYKSEGRKRPATDSAATSTGRKTSNDFPLKQVERARTSADRTHYTPASTSHSSPPKQSSSDLPLTQLKYARASASQKQHTSATTFHSSPPSNNDDVPSCHSTLRSARRDSYNPKPLVELRDGTPSQDIPQPSIEASILPAIHIRRHSVDPSDYVTEPSNTGTLRYTSHAQSMIASERSRGFGEYRQEENQRIVEIQQGYNIPDVLLNVRASMGQTDWMQYVEMMKMFVDGHLDEDELNRGERVLFQVQDERLRRRIRRLVNDMVVEAKE